MSLRWSSYVAPKSPKGASKTQNCRFSLKNALRLKKVCYKVSLCENCQRQSCKAFISLTRPIRIKMIGGGRPLKRKFCIKWTTRPTWRGCRAIMNCDECCFTVHVCTTALCCHVRLSHLGIASIRLNVSLNSQSLHHIHQLWSFNLAVNVNSLVSSTQQTSTSTSTSTSGPSTSTSTST